MDLLLFILKIIIIHCYFFLQWQTGTNTGMVQLEKSKQIFTTSNQKINLKSLKIAYIPVLINVLTWIIIGNLVSCNRCHKETVILLYSHNG